MKAIVLAGGRGVRLYPYTKVLPKPLIPLDDMPILLIILLQLRDAGFTDITLCVHYKAHQIEQYLGDGSWIGIRISYSRSAARLGTAGPLSLVPSLNEPFLVMNGDLLTTFDFADLFARHQDRGLLMTMALCRHNIQVNFGVVEVNEQQQVTGYTEKPNLSYLVNAGIYVFDPAVLSYIPLGVYMDIPELIWQLLAHGQAINSYLFTGQWFDIGTHDQYRRASEEFRRHRSDYLKTSVTEVDVFDQELEASHFGLEQFSDPSHVRAMMTLMWR